MRKIEIDLHRDFWRACRAKHDNTRVTVDHGTVCLVLFGHIIARRYETNPHALYFTLAGHNSQTTRSRLRNVCELSMLRNKGSDPHLGDKRLDPKLWYVVDRRGSQGEVSAL